MGMTDAQWKSHLRALIRDLEQALEESPENDFIKEMIARFRLDIAE